MKLNNGADIEELLKKILSLSLRISSSSPPMKPFIRFSEYPEYNEKAFCPSDFWDFDHLLQKKLLDLVYEIASPDALVPLCIQQWKSNLKRLCERRKQELERAVSDSDRSSFSESYNRTESYCPANEHRRPYALYRLWFWERVLLSSQKRAERCWH